MKPRVQGVLLGIGLVGCATGCSAGVYGAAAGAGGGPSETVAAATTTTTRTLGVRVRGGGSLKRTWYPFLHSQLALAGHSHHSEGQILLVLETRQELLGTRMILVAKPSRGSRYELSVSVRGSANLRGRTVALQLSVYDTHGQFVSFATTHRRLSSGWQPLSVHGRVPIADGRDLRVAIYVSRPTGPPSWLEIRGVNASGPSLTS